VKRLRELVSWVCWVRDPKRERLADESPVKVFRMNP